MYRRKNTSHLHIKIELYADKIAFSAYDMVESYAERRCCDEVFDYSFLNNGLLPANLVNLTANIAELKTMAGVRKEEYIQIFTELEAVAKVQSIKSSNAIEGIVTSDERIAEIVNQNSAPLNHNEAEIAGYRDALNEIHLGYEHIDFREADILRLHEILMQFTGMVSVVSIRRMIM